MRRETSLYLDLARVLAAVAVFIHNAKKESITSGFLSPFGQFGDEAVIIFFVISGIVIAYVTHQRENSATAYAVARLSRLWSVIIPAVILTIILDCIGPHIDRSVYDVFQLPLWRPDVASLWQAAAPIVFFNQIWLWPVGPGTNGPFWSIGYEAWYYIGFGLVIFLRGWVRVDCVIAAAALVGPSILSLAPLWILGVVVFHLLGRGRSSTVAWAIWAATLLIIAMFYLMKYKILSLSFYIMFATTAYSTQFAYIFPCISVAILFAINVVCFDRINQNFRRIGDRLESSIRFLASRTFSLYLYQAPLLFFFGACAAHITSVPVRIAVVYLGTIASVFLLAEISERRKGALAGWLTAAGRRFGPMALVSSSAEGRDIADPRRGIPGRRFHP